MKTLSLLFGMLFLLVSCKKQLVEDFTPDPIYANPLWASFTDRHVTTVFPRFIYSESNFYGYYFENGTPVEADSLQVNGLFLRFNDRCYALNSFALPRTDTTTWVATASANFPAFSYQSTTPLPILDPIVSNSHVYKNVSYKLTSPNGFRADSTRFTVANLSFTAAGSVLEHTFSVSDLENLPVGNSIASITAFTYEKAKINGVWMEFRKETVQQMEVRIWR